MNKWRGNKWMKLGALWLALIVAAGCSGGTGSGGGPSASPGGASQQPGSATEAAQGAAEKEEAPFEISMLNITYLTDPIRDDNITLQKIQEYTNTKLSMTWIPNTAYNDRVNVMIASGELPDIVLVRDLQTAAMINATRSGMFWELTDYIADYPNLSKHPEAVYLNSSIDGKIYGIPRYRDLARYGMIVRKDWLDRLGLAMPKTTAELLDVARAFAKNDPDRNGVDDTYGFLMRENLIELRHLATYLGAPNGWGERDGRLVPDFLTAEFKEAMDILRGFYAEKILNLEFAVTKNNQLFEAFNLSKGGLYLSVLDDAHVKHNDLYSLTPEAEVDIYARINGPAGMRTNSTEGYNGMFMISRSSVKTEEHLKRLLRFLDQLGDEEMENLFKWGVEGTHYKMVDGVPEQDAQLYNDEILIHMVWSDLGSAMKGKQAPLVEKYQQEFANNLDIIVSDPTWRLFSSTKLERGSNLDTLIRDAQTRFIMGEIDEAGWEAAVQQWHNEGGTQVVQEYNEAYAGLK